jgi:hypothetical protein
MKKIILILAIITASCSKQDSKAKQGTTTNTATILKSVSGWQPAQCYYRKLTIAYNIDTTIAKSISIVSGYGFNDIEVNYIEPLKPSETIDKYHQCAGTNTIYYTLILKRKDGIDEVLGTCKTNF